MDIIDQLEALASGERHLPKVIVTRDFLRALAAELRKYRMEHEPFNLTGHLKIPSRDNPLAAAAAVHLSRTEKSGVTPVDGDPTHD